MRPQGGADRALTRRHAGRPQWRAPQSSNGMTYGRAPGQAIEASHHRSASDRFKFILLRGNTLPTSGSTGGPDQVILTKPLAQIRVPDALLTFEKSRVGRVVN